MAASALDIARALIRCPSVTPAEGGALNYLQGLLEDAGFSCQRLVFEEAGTPSVDNLFASIGAGAPHLVFAGHTDVVPPGDEAAWSTPPFAAEVRDGRLIGRGAADMKGGIAAFVAAALAHLQQKPLSGRLSFLITGDEEGPAINGTKKLLAWCESQGIRFDHCLLGEPTNPSRLGEMIKIGRRGSLSGEIIASGRQGHVAYPHKADNPLPALIRVLAALQALHLDDGNAHFQPSNLEITSIDVGNPASNVIPARGRARFNIRFNTEHSLDSLKALIARTVQEAARGAQVEVVFAPNPSDVFLTEPGPFIDLVAGAVEAVTGRRPALSTAGGTSDARYIKDACPVVEFGLVGETMHQVDENIAVDDLERLTAIYAEVLARYFD